MNTTYQIKHILLDFNDYKIFSNGVEMSIDHKAVEVMQMLIENAGQTVNSDDFMDQIWSNKPSSPEVIPAAIARLRKMFKKAGISDDIIVTVHKVGYRFEPIDEVDTAPLYTKQNKRTLLKAGTWALVLTGLLLSIGLNVKHYFNHPKEGEIVGIDAIERHQESLSNVTQIYIIRHTEKTSDTQENPELSTTGIERALYWKKVLQHIQFDQVFTTDFKRNIQTAELISTDSSVKPELYFPMSFDVLKFINLIKGQKVLIIGHSNTIPDMVNRLIDETKYPPMSHENYNTLYLININKNGDTSSSKFHIEKPE